MNSARKFVRESAAIAVLCGAFTFAIDHQAFAQSTRLPPINVAPQTAQRAVRPTVAPPRARARRAARTAPVSAPVTAARDIAAAAGGGIDTRKRILANDQTSATKTSTPVLETPQTISTITRKQIDDQNAQSVNEALNYTAGVLSDKGSSGRYDATFLRGIGGFGQSSNFVSFLDGMRLPRGQYYAATQVDAFLLDRIEIIKGPAAVLYGQISPGGLVNQISRQPSAVPYNEVRIEAGSFGRVQGGVTSTGALDAAKDWLYSISAIGRMSGTRYENVDEQRYGVAPAITWRPDADTRLTVSGFYQNDPKGGYFNSNYVQSLAPPPYRSFLNRNFNPGDPGFDRFSREQAGIGYVFDKQLNDVVSVHSALRYAKVDTDFRGIQLVGLLPNGFLPRIALTTQEQAANLASDNRLRFDFNTLGVGHAVLAGVDQQYLTNSLAAQFGSAPSLSVTDPIYNQSFGPFAPVLNNNQTLTQTGAYVQDQMSFGGFRLTLGTRHDWTTQATVNNLNATRQAQDADKQTYRAGLLYLFDNGLAPYVSYSTSFEPVVGTTFGGAPFMPTTGEQYEAGMKYKPAPFDMLFTASFFEVRQRNVLTPGPVLGFSVQQGEIRSRGLELEARGNIDRNIELVAASTILDTTVTQSTDLSAIGNRPQGVPSHFESLWINYAFLDGTLAGLKLGGGVRSVGSSFGNDTNTLVSPAYVVFDAALRYDLSHLARAWRGAEATLNVTNLSDRNYYVTCATNIYCQFGNGRLVLAGLRYRW